MADRRFTNSDADEYQFKDEEGTHEYADTEHHNVDAIQSSGKKKNLRIKRLLMPILLIAVITVVYQFLNWYSDRSNENSLKQEEMVAKKQAKQPQNTSVVRRPEAIAIPKAPPKLISAPSKATADEDNISVQQKLDLLAEHTNNNIGQLNKVEGSLAQTQGEVVNLNQKISALSSSLQELNNNVNTLKKPPHKPKVIKKLPKKIVKKEVPPQVIYHVKAVVPGLAWLESSTGQTTAVRVGDNLEGYGEVRLISPKQGMVITSNGNVIQYGVNDF